MEVVNSVPLEEPGFCPRGQDRNVTERDLANKQASVCCGNTPLMKSAKGKISVVVVSWPLNWDSWFHIFCMEKL